MKIGYTSNNHSYAILGTNSGQSPFLTKMNKKSINSRNDNINKMRSSNTQVNKANPLSNIIIPNEVSMILDNVQNSKTYLNQETVFLIK